MTRDLKDKARLFASSSPIKDTFAQLDTPERETILRLMQTLNTPPIRGFGEGLQLEVVGKVLRWLAGLNDAQLRDLGFQP